MRLPTKPSGGKAMAIKHPTPLLDQLETGPWPSFVSDIKQEAEYRAANPDNVEFQVPADAPGRPARRA